MTPAKAAYLVGRAGELDWERLDRRTQEHWERIANAVTRVLLETQKARRAEEESGW